MKSIVKIIFLVIILAIIGYVARFHLSSSPSESIKIHFVLPVEHQSLLEIVEGFQESLSNQLKREVRYKVYNAQGDVNLQRSLLQKLAQESSSLVVPVGTNTTQLTLKLIKDKPILSLAAMYTEADRKGYLLTGVLDEIPEDQFVSFLKNVHAPSSKIIIIHSADDRRVKEAIEIERLLKLQKIQVKRLMVHTLNDLYTVSQSFPPHTESVIILKDNLVVSGITVLKKACDQKKIALITSDEGTVKHGASMGFGVTEKDIGRAGGTIAASVLKGSPIQSIPIQHLRDLKVFVNMDYLKTHKNVEPLLRELCARNKYQLVLVKTEAKK